MSISLFEHNERAYTAALNMLSDTGKAAIIHPTGTGKSLVAFKLCEEHPNMSICWLSPSEYIFKTQIENLKNVADGYEPKNVRFYTYAKLMCMSEEEIAEVQPNYFILDEFHRCGAFEWGKGVERMLNAYKAAPVLGLSATKIRYLDNQRDMADELFDGYIASEMTLGEAIVRGILNPPTYVVSLYSYQEDLKKYEERVIRAKNRAVRDTAQKYLNALRHALEKSDGLDHIFQKYMTDRAGKYIVFCANAKHMDEMISHVSEWFRSVDEHPIVYRAYSEDPETSKAFANFKADTSEHLKLLFCIDMLNEGIHVEDISGVILLRPTISPIIYKQQIGRTLSASKSKQGLILDIVSNISNLYSIDAIQEEIQTAVNYYRFIGDNSLIINDKFTIIDEALDCRELFSKLEQTLSASWETMFGYAKSYFEKNKNLDIPKRYKTPEGYSLGHWLNTQRLVRAGKSAGILTEKQIFQLDSIGMRWENKYDHSWNQYYQALCDYKEQYGNLDILADYVTQNGLQLGGWISNLRYIKASNKRSYYLTNERVETLNALGMIWDKFDYLWEQNYFACVEYYMQHQNLDIPIKYVSANGLRIGSWVRRQRQIRAGRWNGSLTNEQIERLDAIGMNWTDHFTQKWEYGYEQAKKYRNKFGNLDVPSTYITENGFPLGKWLRKHIEINPKTGKTEIKITPERCEKLTALGMSWDKPDPWGIRYALVKAYFDEHGNLDIPADYIVDGIWLNKWLNEQKQIYHGKRRGKALTPEQVKLLEKISFDWRNKSERAWESQYDSAQRYYAEHGNLNVPYGYISDKGTKLRNWLNIQRKHYKNGKLSSERILKLSDIGMIW